MQNESLLELRLTQLEKQLKRQKTTTLALFIGSILAVSATRVISQNSKSELSLRTLKIVGADGKTKVLISGDAAMNKEGGAIAVFDNKENVRLGLMASSKGGNVSILRNDSEPMAILGFDGDGGTLGLAANGSKTQVNVAATKDVSGMVVSGPNGKEHIVAGADKTGGVVQLYDFAGQLKKQLP
ncbi:hypothetical protein B1R32_105118 [Abditibacterium utsteinense]|uniref:Uncharacterized protein n=1 Tax=Abditibacterium utsteinense TaxID=1960156 RepID=A0A2S8SUF2_9BACT|nr:hypothetical protein [Abditibacterium utsteinense]PQV64437.1 hypothetical protein B1R32_105118 [Abditibacterium utsteinense]